MTLIVTYASYPVVMQVSDRRLTFPNGSIVDDDSTKSIVWNNSWILSYTGLARIGKQSTCEWLAELLADNHQKLRQGYLDRRLTELGGIIGKVIAGERGTRDQKPLAIVGAGWAVPWDVSEPPPEGLHPFVWHLSNYLDEDGEPTATVRTTFDCRIARARPLRKSEMGVLTHGQSMEPLEWKSLFRALKRARKHNTTPLVPARLIVEAVQRMKNRYVGDSVLVSSLPVPWERTSDMLLNRPPNWETPSFLYVSPNGEWKLQRAPIYVNDGAITQIDHIDYGISED